MGSDRELEKFRGLFEADLREAELIEAERQRAIRTCAQHARDANDLRHMLLALGLVEKSEMTPSD